MSTSYFDMLDAVENYYGSGSDQWLEIAKYGISADNAESILSQVPGINLIKNSDGTIRSFTYDAFSSITSGSSIAEELNSNLQSGTASIVNNTKINIPSNMGVNESGKLTFKSGMKNTGKFVFGEVVPAIAAASVGISLGKTIDKTLYNLNPDFWDERGMASLNPDTWSSITSDDDSLGAKVFNMVFGIDGDETQCYIDEKAYAYLALLLQNKGFFNSGNSYSIIKNPDNWEQENIIPLQPLYTGDIARQTYNSSFNNTYTEYRNVNAGKSASYAFTSDKVDNIGLLLADKSKQNVTYHLDSTRWDNYKDVNLRLNSSTANGKTFYWNVIGTGRYTSEVLYNEASNNKNINLYKYAYLLLFGDYVEEEAIKGVGNQENADLPDLSNIDNIDDCLSYLKNKYPELWNKAIEQDIVQPDGTITTYKYIPVPTPEGTSKIDTKPVSGDSSQSNTLINPDTSTKTLLDLITSIITTPPTNTDIPDTGKGDTPPVVLPSGSASALYSIYNPTQAELNNFGAWLWSSNFVDQLLKLFNDPMQAIIGLHKVFAAPGISGSSTIKVGYLDSGVTSNVVGSQYTTIDCGEISISEYFGNVFDYDPFTCVYIYLPFIGIEKLDTGDVMRGRLRVIYHVDVLNGACLAEIRVTRDGAGGTLYTYTGNCAVQYPISSGSYMGIIASMASVAGGVVGTIASGGALAPVAMGAVSGVLNAHTRVQHSGGFSGNAGAMGIKTPYVIITRPQTCLADNFPEFDGYPSNKSTTLSSCSGFVKVKSCHVNGIPATDAELSEIEMLLKSGVII